MIWKRLFGRSERDEVPYALYGALVAQARSPEFYMHLGVPDTMEGRYEMVMLHAFLVLRRVKRMGESGKELGQNVFDILFDDMDQTLREIGVGDLSVGKKVKGLAAAFYGRIAAYEEGLEKEEPAVLEEALKRNLYAMASPTQGQLAALANYMRAADAHLAAQSTDEIAAGRIGFVPAPAAIERTEA
jgi:cytochrome b pre-mRNA-processing protein 3